MNGVGSALGAAGEVSGARPVGYQENFPFTLAHSGLQGSVAKEHYRFQAEDTAGLIPDHPVAWTWTDYAAGSAFDVPANSSFEIAVDSGIAEYVCSFE